MIAWIRRMFDCARMAQEIERLEAQNASLRRQLDGKVFSGLHFMAVAKEFDAKPLFDHAIRHIIKKYEPIILPEMFRTLEHAAEQLSHSYTMRGWVTADVTSRDLYHLRLHMPEYNLEFPAYSHAPVRIPKVKT